MPSSFRSCVYAALAILHFAGAPVIVALCLAFSMASPASPADFTVTTTHKVKNNSYYAVGLPAELGPVAINDVTACYGALCVNFWNQKALEEGKFQEDQGGSLANETDGPDVWVNVPLGKFTITPEYNKFYLRQGNSLHSLQVNASRRVGRGISAFGKVQQLFAAAGNFPEGGTIYFGGVTGSRLFTERLSVEAKAEAIRDSGVVGGRPSTSARISVLPSIALNDRFTVNLGVECCPQLSGDPNGYRRFAGQMLGREKGGPLPVSFSAGVTIKWLMPKP